MFALLSNLFVKTSLLRSLFLLLCFERIICLTRNGAILRNCVRQRGTYWRWKEREWVWRCLRHPPAGLRPTLLRDIHHCSRVDFTRVLCLQATVLLRYQWANSQHLLHSDHHAYTYSLSVYLINYCKYISQIITIEIANQIKFFRQHFHTSSYINAHVSARIRFFFRIFF